MKRTMVVVAAVVVAIAASALAATTSADSSSLQRGGGANCDDFATQAAAQSYFNSHGPGDPAGLDADNDGIACEANPCPCSTGGGGGGGGGGGAPPPAPPPIKKQNLCGKILGATGSKVCLKAVTQGGKLKRVEDFKFRGLPVRCGPPPKRKVAGKELKIDGDGRKFASKKVELRGNPSRLQARVEGKVEGSGKAKGEIRARFIDGQGFACDSRLRKWKAS